MLNKICSECKNLISLEDFAFSKRGFLGRRSKCKKCNTSYNKKYYDLHKKEEASRTTIYRQANVLKYRGYESQLNRHYKTLLQIAKLRKYPVSITFEEYKILRERRCHYCSGPLPRTGAGVDRVDNSQGYHLTNLVPCCRNCNVIKSDLLTQQELQAVVALLQKLRNRDNIW